MSGDEAGHPAHFWQRRDPWHLTRNLRHPLQTSSLSLFDNPLPACPVCLKVMPHENIQAAFQGVHTDL